MTALIVRIGPVRNAVNQSARLGMAESRQDVVKRVLGDIRDGHHAYTHDPRNVDERDPSSSDTAHAGAA